MKRLYYLFFFITVIPGYAQTSQSFQEFRKSLYNDYENFRQTLLDHYADFLNGVWHEYEPLLPLTRDETPKPTTVPNIEETKPSLSPKNLPSPKNGEMPPKIESISFTQPDKKDVLKPDVPYEAGKIVPLSLKINSDIDDLLLSMVPINVQPTSKALGYDSELDKKDDVNTPDNVDETNIGLNSAYVEVDKKEMVDKEVVNFYGMEILVPKVEFNIRDSLNNAFDFANNWRLLEDQAIKDDLLAALQPVMKELSLNDYLTYDFLCAYIDSKFAGLPSASKMATVHYILSHLGYDVRIGMTTGSGTPVILMPTEQFVYGKPYLTLNGQNYFIINPPGADINGQGIATCDLPKIANKGKNFNLIINGLNLPIKEHPFKVEYGGITLSGVINENLMPLVYRYPQMGVANYALSVLDPDLRNQLVDQLKQQLSDKDKLTATNDLLKFVQSGFDYATDGDFHGFEKPYFLEENFYYPKNDCEDRAIFYTYMLWNVLGVENQLLFYPGHESASVTLEGKIYGSNYDFNGKRFYISDPTFIGAITGQCMPRYETTKPRIDLALPNKK